MRHLKLLLALLAALVTVPAASGADIMDYGPVEPPPRFDGQSYSASSRNVAVGQTTASAPLLPPEVMRALIVNGILGAADEAGRDAWKDRQRRHDRHD